MAKQSTIRTFRFIVRRADAGSELKAFLARKVPCSGAKAKAFLDARSVFVNGEPVWMARHGLQPGDTVELMAPRTRPADLRARILYTDDRFLVIDKPPGLLSVDRGSIESLLRTARKEPGLRAAHRLDRDTSGCLLLARSERAHRDIVESFRRHRVTKVYHAIVAGHVGKRSQTILSPVDNKRATTRFRVLSANDRGSHLQVNIQTGRKHQIRQHVSSVGHPVLGDTTYRWGRRPPVLVPRQMLHASVLEFDDPATERRIRAVAPLPDDFRACLRELKLR